MRDLKEFCIYFKDHPLTICTTCAAMAAGAVLGAVAFYQGWLG